VRGARQGWIFNSYSVRNGRTQMRLSRCLACNFAPLRFPRDSVAVTHPRRAHTYAINPDFDSLTKHFALRPKLPRLWKNEGEGS